MTVVSPLDQARRAPGSSLRGPALVGAVGLGAAALLHLRDPHESGTYGFCPFLEITGKPCPGCGGLRAVNDLTRGDVVGAISSNALAVALAATLGVAWIVWFVRRLRGRPGGMLAINLPVGLAMIGVVAVFGIVRVTPWGSWLAP